MNRLHLPATFSRLASQFVVIVLLSLVAPQLSAQPGLLVFIDDAPADTSLNCYNDLGPSALLRAQRVLNGGLVDTIFVSSVDSLSAADAVCAGGIVFRIWEERGTVNTIRQVQEITFGAPTTDSAPAFEPTTLPALRTLVDCRTANDPQDINGYQRWLSERRIATATGVTSGCVDLLSITDDAPLNASELRCLDSLVVTFTATDICDRAALVSFTYVTIDTVAPLIIGVASDTFSISCSDGVPTIPQVTLSDCDAEATLSFNEASTQTPDGSCQEYDYDVERSWIAIDACGNMTIVRQFFEVRDTDTPDFIRPVDINLRCTQDPFDLEVTGRPTSLTDNCTPLSKLDIAFTDEVISIGSCENRFDVQRTWQLTDACGNSRIQIQRIRVRDEVDPVFTPPAAVVNASCATYENLDITGRPTQLFDLCDPTVNLIYEDEILPGNCPGNFTVERNFRIFDDCGNDVFFLQKINVTDTLAPVFLTTPRNLETSCNVDQRQARLFSDWLRELAEVEIIDDCTKREDIRVQIVETGTNTLPVLPPLLCTGENGTVRQVSVDIILTDGCRNSVRTTVFYRQIDDQPVNIFNCPASQVVATNANECVASFRLSPPTIQDQCNNGAPLQLNLRDTTTITSQAMNQAELGSVPVDPLEFNLFIGEDLPVNGESPGILTITLDNIDAEGLEEYFFIYAEDGTLLGTTERGLVQCETVITIDTIQPFDFTRWASDGVITFRLEPNIPAGRPGTFAINNLCTGGSTARIHLRMPTRRVFGIVYEVNIDEVGFETVAPIVAIPIDFELGLHRVSYRATDCGGSVDECTFTITVEDQEAPLITCPQNLEVFVGTDSCRKNVTLPLPLTVVDNCEPYELSSESFPAASGLLFFPFQFDPNLNTFQARSVFTTLRDIPGNLTDSIDVDVTFFGTFGNPRAMLDVLLPDGTIVGSSRRGDASCETAGQLNVRIAATDLLSQTNAAGELRLEFRPRVVTVPPGQAGDGVTPCDEDAIREEGGDDGQSGLGVRITYRALFPSYFSNGATEIPLIITSPDRPSLEAVFHQGVSLVSYLVDDPGGNSGVCTFRVTVQDTIPPVVVCRATTVFVDPSGLAPVFGNPTDIASRIEDNCSVDSLRLSPASFTCDAYGTTQAVTLFVTDLSGNTASCNTFVSVAPLRPVPTASTTLCGGDTLRLFANVPTQAAPGQTIYTFQWFAPSGAMISTRQNPVIPGVTEAGSGAYRVVIRGLTGCESAGVVNVGIGGTPAAAVITAPQRVCEGENVTLSSTSSYVGNVRYEWYRGQPGAGEFLGQRNVATFTASFAEGEDSGTFYAIAFVNGCEAAPSNLVTVGSAIRPEISVLNQVVSACQFGEAVLRAIGPENLRYEWTGPGDFSTVGRVITLPGISEEDAGAYRVRAIRSEGCFSESLTINLLVTPASEPTTLAVVGSVCPADTLLLVAQTDVAATYFFFGPNDLAFSSVGPELRVSPVTSQLAGEWTVRVQRGSCPSVPSPPITVTVGQRPVPGVIMLPDPVCTGNDLILQGSSNLVGSTYNWSGPNGFESDGIAVSITDIDTSFNGDYVLTLTSPNGCTATDTLAVTVLPGIVIDSITVSSGRCLSGGEPVSLSASISPALPDGYAYRWRGPEGTSTNDTFLLPNVSLASNGIYTLEVTNERGCVSPALSVPVEFNFAPSAPLPPFTEQGVTAFCEGEDVRLRTNDFGAGASYLWRLGDGTNIPTATNTLNLVNVRGDISGTFTVRVIRNGCPSPPSPGQTFTITAFPAITVMTNAPACTGQPINFQATDLSGATYAWRGPNNFSSSLPNPSIVSANANVHAGIYSLVVSRNGCVADTIFVDLAVRPTPGVPVIQPVNPICINDAAAVLNLTINPNTATGGASYHYFIQQGQVAVGESSTTGMQQLTDFGLFTGGGMFGFQVRATRGGCSSELSAPVSIRLDDIGSVAPNAGRDTIICSGMHVLSAGAAGIGSGRWTVVSGTGDINIMSPTNRVTVVEGLTEFGGPYAFAWTLSNGTCTNYAADTVVVAITDGEEADAGDNILACIRETVRLSASPVTMMGSGGTWSQALAQELLGVVIVSPSDPNTVIVGLQSDNTYSFTWTVTSNCGIKEDITLVNVSDPTPFAGDDEIACTGDRSTVLMADGPTIGSNGRWRSIDGEVSISDPDNPVTMVIGLRIGENRFVWEMDGGFCGNRSRDTVSITYLANPAPMLDEYSLDFQGAITFDPTENDDIPDGSVLTFGEIPMGSELTDNGDGTYTFRAPANFVGELEVTYEVSGSGCDPAAASIFFLIGKETECIPPNIFTPNNDGVNDFFVVPCLLDTDQYPESRVTIYNQWGDEVYRSGMPYPSDWDGTYQGSELPAATYFYTIDYGTAQKGASGAVRIER